MTLYKEPVLLCKGYFPKIDPYNLNLILTSA